MQLKTESTILPNKDQSFTHFELNLDSREKQCLADFKIERPDEINGILEEFAQSLDTIKGFINSLGENDLESCSTIAHLILTISQKALTLFQQESAHVLIRAFIPNDNFKYENYQLPRWHQDGYYFRPYEGEPLKAVVTLKGPGTLFFSPSANELEQFKEIKKDRIQLAKFLVEDSKISSTPDGHGTVFIVGSEASAIHTVPYINSQRLFISILPGTKKQIEGYDAILKLVARMSQEHKSEQEVLDAVKAHPLF